jgi:hypothetical protein
MPLTFYLLKPILDNSYQYGGTIATSNPSLWYPMHETLTSYEGYSTTIRNNDSSGQGYYLLESFVVDIGQFGINGDILLCVTDALLSTPTTVVEQEQYGMTLEAAGLGGTSYYWQELDPTHSHSMQSSVILPSDNEQGNFYGLETSTAGGVDHDGRGSGNYIWNEATEISFEFSFYFPSDSAVSSENGGITHWQNNKWADPGNHIDQTPSRVPLLIWNGDKEHIVVTLTDDVSNPLQCPIEFSTLPGGVHSGGSSNIYSTTNFMIPNQWNHVIFRKKISGTTLTTEITLNGITRTVNETTSETSFTLQNSVNSVGVFSGWGAPPQVMLTQFDATFGQYDGAYGKINNFVYYRRKLTDTEVNSHWLAFQHDTLIH